ncbi:hypothetical protein OQA88_11784 [Cercophora sp. LCS_1]
MHAVAMERSLLRCKFVTGVPLVELGALPPHHLERALSLMRDPDWHEHITDPYPPLATILYYFSVIGKSHKGLQIVETALAGLDSEDNRQAETSAALLGCKALLLIRLEDWLASTDCLEKAMALAKSQVLRYDLRLILATVTSKEGKVHEAVEIMTDCVADASASLGFDHPWVTNTVILLEHVLVGEKSPTFDSVGKRLRLLEPYTAYAEETAPHSETSRYILLGLGSAYKETGAIDRALPLLKAILYGPQSHELATALCDLAWVMTKANDGPEAIEACVYAAGILGPEDGKEYWHLCSGLRDGYTIMKDWEEATKWGRKAVEASAAAWDVESGVCDDDRTELERIIQLEVEDMANKSHT